MFSLTVWFLAFFSFHSWLLMFPRWSPQFHFLNSSSPERGFLNRINSGTIHIQFLCYFPLLKNGSITEQSNPFPPTSLHLLVHASTTPPTHTPLPLTLYLVLLLTGLWRSKLPLLKPCLLNHKILEHLLFYECMIQAEVIMVSLWKFLYFSCLLLQVMCPSGTSFYSQYT